MRMVWCTFDLIGFHKYPNPPANVAFLGDRHRHKFYFKVSIEVGHDNREIEFLTLQRWCLDQFTEGALELHNQSCEMLAQALITLLMLDNVYGTQIRDNPISGMRDRQMIVEVSEDNENGATYSRF